MKQRWSEGLGRLCCVNNVSFFFPLDFSWVLLLLVVSPCNLAPSVIFDDIDIIMAEHLEMIDGLSWDEV